MGRFQTEALSHPSVTNRIQFQNERRLSGVRVVPDFIYPVGGCLSCDTRIVIVQMRQQSVPDVALSDVDPYAIFE